MNTGQAEKAPFKTRVVDGLLWCCGPFVWLGAWARLYLHALWVARVSVASLIVALVLFITVPQAQDLFIELKWMPEGYFGLHWGFVHWAWFYLLAFCLWVVPVYFSARLALQTNIGRMQVDTYAKYHAIIVYLPRLLGVLCFVAITIGIWRAYKSLPRAAGSDEHILEDARHQLQLVLWASIAFNMGLMVLFYVLPALPVLRRLHQVLPPVYWALRRSLDWLSQPSSRVIHRPPPPPTAPTLVDFQEFNIHRNILISVAFWLIIIWVVNLLIVVISPRQAGDILPRANLVPIMLGALVPALTFLAVLSHRLRHPCILYFIGFLVFLTWLTPTWHDVKCLPLPGKDANQGCRAVPGPRQVTLEQAVTAWKTANTCTTGNCPQPIIVAGQGGASRAAFVTASALAHLEEISTSRDWTGGRFSDRLFAISAVSGSGLGAAVFVGALEAQEANAIEKDPWPRWLKPWTCNWFGCHHEVEQKVEKEVGPLKRAVQQAIAGDFLTSVFMALVFHDAWRFDRLGMKSRAAVLEEAWHQGFDEIFKTGFLKRPLSGIGPAADVKAGDRNKWRPLLIFNGTSVETGDRIVTSSLAPQLRDKSKIFNRSADFYDLMCRRDKPERATSDCACTVGPEGVKRPACDISVTTAIMNTARFPIVSPPGNIKSPPGNLIGEFDDSEAPKVVDLIVDGGYFENSGALTALELAEALKSLGLKPFILQVSNDPEMYLKECDTPAPQSSPDARRPFGIVRDPIDTVLNSRVARGYLAIETARASRPASFAHVGVCPELEADPPAQADTDKKSRTGGPGGKYKQLSYSWWLSMPVQQYLHRQVLRAHNTKAFEHVIRSLRHKEAPEGS